MSEWSDWILHDGKHVPVGKYVQTVMLDGEVWEGVAGLEEGSLVDGKSGWLWNPVYGPDDAHVIRYRIRRPLGLTILEQILNDLPAPTKPTVPA